MRVLVCGGRDFNEPVFVYKTLDALHAQYGFTTMINGGAKGADTLAKCWARLAKIEVITEPARWATYGRGAGHIRNKKMLDEHKPDVVVAFPGGVGTENMKKLALMYNLPLLEIEDPR